MFNSVLLRGMFGSRAKSLTDKSGVPLAHGGPSCITRSRSTRDRSFSHAFQEYMQQDQTEVDVYLNYRSSVCVGDTEHSCGGGYILKMEAVVMGHAEGSIGKNPVGMVLGNLKFYIIRVGNASNDRVHLHDVFDAFQETVDVGNAIYDASYSEFTQAVRRLFPDANPWCDILILHYLTILPCARGQRLGLSVLERVMRDWSSGCSLVVMKPFPLQFESRAKKDRDWEHLALGKFPGTQREAFQRLRAYYELLGFERIGRSQFYARCPENVHPTAKTLGLPSFIVLPASEVKKRLEANR